MVDVYAMVIGSNCDPCRNLKLQQKCNQIQHGFAKIFVSQLNCKKLKNNNSKKCNQNNQQQITTQRATHLQLNGPNRNRFVNIFKSQSNCKNSKKITKIINIKLQWILSFFCLFVKSNRYYLATKGRGRETARTGTGVTRSQSPVESANIDGGADFFTVYCLYGADIILSLRG